MADAKKPDRKPRRRRALRPEDITVHWRWKELPDLSQEEADRLGEVALGLVARRLAPLLARQVARDLLREEQASSRPAACMLCGQIAELLGDIALKGRDQSARLCPTCQALYDCGIVKAPEIIAARDAWCDGAWPEATRLHRRIEAELARGEREVKRPAGPPATPMADSTSAVGGPARRRKLGRSEDS